MATSTNLQPPLHSLKLLRRRHFNRVFAVVYVFALLTHFYLHILQLLNSPTTRSFLISLALFISDIILAYMWSTTQACRMNPVSRQSYPENIGAYLSRKDFPGLDIFICTADPYKEPPINVVNTALSVMAYDYPTEKLSVYVSDDGGSELTMFAFMEAAKFGKVWLPFCRENNVMDRCPDAYFRSSNFVHSAKAMEIKTMYQSMKTRVVNAVERGTITDEYICNEEERRILSQYRIRDFTRQNHPSVIQVLLNSQSDLDVTQHRMPNLVYMSREKSKNTTHHFKAGALNALLRVSGVMTNAPIVLTLDCDMYSNDPLTPQRALCYLSDKSNKRNCGYVQFPQKYHGINIADIYACEHKRLFIENPTGMDGLNGTSYVGTGCFFKRRAFFGGPLSYIEPEIPDLCPNHAVVKPNNGHELLSLANHVSQSTYEDKTIWGSKVGFRYGSLVEDYYTGYRLQCEGWQSIFCNPSIPAFLGDIPITLIDAVSQTKRWGVGLLEVGFSKFSPLTFGIKSMGILMAQAYAYYAFWATWSIPITIYAILPSLAFLNGVTIFPKANELWFFVYIFLFLGAYGQDLIDFMLSEGTIIRWWSDQRMWLIRGLSSYVFAIVEFVSKSLGVETHGFNVTSKVMDDEQGKRYDHGVFEFGIASPMFVLLAMIANLNLLSVSYGVVHVFMGRSVYNFIIEILIPGFGVLNSLPFYGGMFLRYDKGRLPRKTTITSIVLVGALCISASYILVDLTE